MKSVLINRQDVINFSKLNPNCVYIGRNIKTYPYNFGNPFSCLDKTTTSTIKAIDNDTSVLMFEEWLLGKNYFDINQSQREWILNQISSGDLCGKHLYVIHIKVVVMEKF